MPSGYPTQHNTGPNRRLRRQFQNGCAIRPAQRLQKGALDLSTPLTLFGIGLYNGMRNMVPVPRILHGFVIPSQADRRATNERHDIQLTHPEKMLRYDRYQPSEAFADFIRRIRL
jgi:hypothetical protein